MPGGDNALAVINATTCNATNTSGCAAGPVATVATGNVPLGLAEDPLSHTLYVANIVDNTVSLIDVSHCTAQQTAGCSQVAPTVSVGNAPVALALDARSHSVYVANAGDNTVSVIDTSTCSAKHPTGCPASPPTQAVGGAPNAVATSSDGGTVYVANSGNGPNGIVGGGSTVSLIDATACNGGHPQGCSTTPAPVAGVGGEQDDQPQSLAFDPATHNLYAANSSDDSVSVLDGSACAARHIGGCPQTAPDVQSGGSPNALAALPSQHTVYVVDGVDGAVAVISDRGCTNTHPLDCRAAPAIATVVGRYDALASGVTVDAADHTAYFIDYGVGFGGPFVVDLIDTSTCNAATTTGCVSPAGNFAPKSTPNGVTVDPASDTVYLSEGGPGADQVEVIDGHHCNAAHSTGCAGKAVIPIDATSTSTGQVVIDEATKTAYVYAFGPQQIEVIDISHCNATDASGCSSQPVAHIPFADPVLSAGVGHDTLYADALPNFDSTVQGYVGVFDTRHCRAGHTTGCASLAPATVTVGRDPTSLAVDAVHKTVYVTDNAEGESAGVLSMIDTTRCNGDDSSGCSTQAPPTTPAGRSVLSASLDPSAGTLYVANFSDASLFAYDTASCNAATQSGCPSKPPEVIVGSGPSAAAIDPSSQTVYVPNFWDGTVSLVPAQH
jgi:DNA-binding beta-propeller fold protein YncE